MEEDIARIAEEIAGLIGENGDVEEIKKSLKKYVNLGIDIPSARQVILKKYGVKGSVMGGEEVELADLEGGESSINLLVRILSVTPKRVNIGGSEKEIFYGLMADRSGIRRFTAWENFGLKAGQTYRIEGAYTKIYRGEVEVNLGTLAGVEEAPEELQDLDVRNLPRFGTPREVKIAEITPKINLITVIGKVVQAAEKTVKVSGEEKEIQEGVLGDETGTIRFTNWGDSRFEVGKTYRIEGAYVKNWRGIPQLGIDDRCVVEEGGEVVVVEGREVRKTLSDLMLRGEQDVEVEGCILEVREGSGLIFRCPVCNRVLRDSSCMVHGPQQGYPDLRVKAVLDDGFGAAQVVLNREITSKILEMTPEEALEVAEGRGETLWVEEELRKRLEGRWFRMRGTSILDDFGPTLLPKEITPLDDDPREEAERLLKEAEGVLL